jgi:uncharacterized protein YciI
MSVRQERPVRSLTNFIAGNLLRKPYEIIIRGEIIVQDDDSADQSEKRYFVLKLIPPRPTFAEDMTEEERTIMTQHAAYWIDKADKRIAVVFGPVLDPKGVYGLAIIDVENEDQAQTFAAEDPAVKSGLQRLEIYPMRATVRK